jgi:uncharacterized protein YbjT (DUF2867 family)
MGARTGLEIIKGDLLDRSVLEKVSRGMDAIVSCLGIRKDGLLRVSWAAG